MTERAECAASDSQHGRLEDEEKEKVFFFVGSPTGNYVKLKKKNRCRSSARYARFTPMSPSISIRLTEPVVFLRDLLGTPEGRQHGAENHSPPSFVRGLVTLTLVKPTRVSSIEVTLEGKVS